MPWNPVTTTATRGQSVYRLRAAACALLTAALVVGACGSSGEDDPAALTPPELDLETMEGHSEDVGSYGQAERAESSYVGAIDEGQAIGVAPIEELAYAEAASGGDLFLVQVYDRDRTWIIVDELNPDGATTLEGGGVGDFEATVELEIGDDAVSGTVAFPSEQAKPFTADAAAGISGVYSAFGAEENPDTGANWVVLPDGRQWGSFTCWGSYFYTLICGGHVN